jgi:hypothetical protein
MYNTYVKLINLMVLNDCTKWSTGEGLDRALILEATLKSRYTRSRGDTIVWKISGQDQEET